VALDLETFTVIGVAVIEVAGGARSGFGPAPGTGLDGFIAEVLIGGSKSWRR
jgi:hypothetical protein